MAPTYFPDAKTEANGVSLMLSPVVRRGAWLHRQRLRSPVVALSLGGLRRRIEALMVPDSVDVVLRLDGLAERERHRRRAQAQLSRIAQLDQMDCPRGPMSALGGSGRAGAKLR